ncbi:hypothetical protein NH340_JMT06666 [Sarcoptes scabiei]|nr:hypothetical protein NH340_JMT06666 [Sarcoptes scabiei]
MNRLLTLSKSNFTKNVEDYSIENHLNPDQTLWKAKNRSLNVQCVLRKINLIDVDLELLENESNLDEIVDHPNIINMIENFVQKDYLYTIFPFANYGSIDKLCKPYGLEEGIIALVMKDLLPALDYLHRNNIIHRAIKGSNILIFGDAETSFKFTLSGLKHSFLDDSTSFLNIFDYPTTSSKLLNHLAPEILEQNILGYNYKSDIHSVGILCCELANGIIPFDNISTDELLFYKIIGDTPRLLDHSCDEMNIFQELIDRLEISLKQRYRIYMKKRFSSAFHDFVQQCLHCEPINRPKAYELMEHTFCSLNKSETESYDRFKEILKKKFHSQ